MKTQYAPLSEFDKLKENQPKEVYPILVVDDNHTNLSLIERILKKAGFPSVVTCDDSRKVLNICAEQPFAVMLLDLKMPHIQGEDLLPEIKARFPGIHVIVVTALRDTRTIVDCMKKGAFDYVAKPVEREILISAINRVLTILKLQKENVALRRNKEDLKHPQAFAKIITQSQKMMEIFADIESIAPSPWPVLITGETGVGKELIAHVIHQLSGRKGEIVTVNAAGLDRQMFSDMLFGHAKGAYTGADRDKKGLIHSARAGTIFFDEIGDLDWDSQIKLLRLIQEGEFFPLGGETVHRTDARTITATNQDLWRLQREGRFREDLNYRLRTHHIHVPPLRERMEDLPLLADHFMEEAARRQQIRKPVLPGDWLAPLEKYNFPGNIRELRSIVFDTVSRNPSGPIAVNPMPSRQDRQPLTTIDPAGLNDALARLFPEALPTLKQASRWLIREALKRTGNNQTMAAEMLGISQSALSRRLKK
ncbi:MAG: sigma-54-dependent transcriptional regulator [Thermodesulfobacteriota bacterium]